MVQNLSSTLSVSSLQSKSFGGLSSSPQNPLSDTIINKPNESIVYKLLVLDVEINCYWPPNYLAKSLFTMWFISWVVEMLQWQHPEYSLPLYYILVLLNLDVKHLIGRLFKYRIQFDYYDGHFVHKKLDYVTRQILGTVLRF